MNSYMRIRSSALIIENNSVLLVEFNDETGLHYNLPGGTVEQEETITEALRREVKEETNIEIEVGSLLFVIEYEPKRNSFWAGSKYVLSFIFGCKLSNGQMPSFPMTPDTNQTDVKWVKLDELDSVELLPHITEHIIELAQGRKITQLLLEEPVSPERAQQYIH